MRLVRRIAAVVLVLLLAALVGGYFYARPLLKTGTGYDEHTASGHHPRLPKPAAA